MAEDHGCDADARETLDLHRKALTEGNHGPRFPRSRTIERLGRFAEELHDRGPIEPRSSRDRGALGEIVAHDHFKVIAR